MIQPRRLTIVVIVVSNLIMVLFYLALSSLSLHEAPNDDPRTASLHGQGNANYEETKGRISIPTYDPNERYLAYLPHAGFHNQRISLENAFLLAKYLNRTLLVPPVFLGPATEWRPFEILLRRIQLQTKRGLDHCNKIHKYDPLPAECLNYYSWTLVEWEFFYDMEKIRRHQPFKLRKDHSWSWMETHLGIDRHKDVYITQDRAHYDYQIFDDPNSTTPLNKERYLRRLELKELVDRPERVLHMGSMFATGRVMAELPQHKEYQQFLRRTMILNTPILVKTSDTIVHKLGGLGTFIGLHVRVGDGMFVGPAPRNIAAMFKQLVNLTGIVPMEEMVAVAAAADSNTPGAIKKELPELSSSSNAAAQLEQPRHGLGTATAGPGSSGSESGALSSNSAKAVTREGGRVPRPPRLTVQQCMALKHQGGKYTTIYIATDGMYPRKNMLFRQLFAHFPCIFTLDDFIAEDLKELKELRNTDGVGLGRDLIPMVDAVVSAKGRYFMGTPKSTFSTYVSKQLHPAFVEHLYDKDGNPVLASSRS
ncbi:hypothetical protein DFQ27_003691 [Actinomortierella ambigua]|uniref:O-fucosyltransferase family protein n=1 Tax=Actinomortierella ambigua TaxID=1343610 RepID=A0A9P6Q3Z3_9FUNG|nr:hypothetical protein DFQ27_003691 [Actinomortierella ambigua]